MQTRNYRNCRDSAFSFMEMVVAITILGLLVSFGVPIMVKARTDTRLEVIYVNLTEVESAKDRWALDQNKPVGEPVPDLEVLTNYMIWANFCPVANEAYVPNPVGSPPTATVPDTTRIGPYGPGQTIALPSRSPQVSGSTQFSYNSHNQSPPWQ
jgi:prepilin-type N-terminal cleavage/methylation domain-containing protein